MKRDNNNNHRICKSIIRIFYAVIIFVLAQVQDYATVQQLIALSATVILLAPVSDWMIDWISDYVSDQYKM